MPLIDVTLTEGRSGDQIRALISALTVGTVDAIGTPRESIRVIVREVPKTHWAAGDVTIAERQARADTQVSEDSPLPTPGLSQSGPLS